MNNKTMFPKIATDMFLKQLQWVGSYLGIVMIIYLIGMIAKLFTSKEASDFYSLNYFSASIFMFVAGILIVGFMEFFISNGITRKTYFFGGTIAAILLAITIPIVVAVISVVEKVVLNFINLPIVMEDPGINAIEKTGDRIGDFVQTIVVVPFVDLNSNFLLSIMIFSLNLFIYYLVGWFIGVAFYRPSAMLRFFSIVLTLLIIFLHNNIIRSSLNYDAHSLFSSFNLSLPIAFLVVIVIIGAVILTIRQLTRNVVIKL